MLFKQISSAIVDFTLHVPSASRDRNPNPEKAKLQ